MKKKKNSHSWNTGETILLMMEMAQSQGASSSITREKSKILEKIFRGKKTVARTIADDELEKLLAKKNRIQTAHNRVNDYKNEECCERKGRKTLNKEPIKDLRRYRRSFLFRF